MNSRLILVGCFALVALMGCSRSADENGADPTPTTASTGVPSSVSSPDAVEQAEEDAGRESRVQDAQDVKHNMDPLIAELQRAYGEGGNSPCAAASSELFTGRCSEAVKATADVARTAVEEIGPGDDYETLRRVTGEVLAADRGYRLERCDTDPKDAAVRAQCLQHGAVIAQAPTDLHQGVVAGLLGK